MTLLSFGTDHAASPHGGGIDPKTMRGVVIGIVLVLAAIGILAVSNVIGSTVKERVTDPVIDKGVEAVSKVGSVTFKDANSALEASELEILAALPKANSVEFIDITKDDFIGSARDMNQKVAESDPESYEEMYSSANYYVVAGYFPGNERGLVAVVAIRQIAQSGEWVQETLK